MSMAFSAELLSALIAAEERARHHHRAILNDDVIQTMLMPSSGLAPAILARLRQGASALADTDGASEATRQTATQLRRPPRISSALLNSLRGARALGGGSRCSTLTTAHLLEAIASGPSDDFPEDVPLEALRQALASVRDVDETPLAVIPERWIIERYPAPSTSESSSAIPVRAAESE